MRAWREWGCCRRKWRPPVKCENQHGRCARIAFISIEKVQLPALGKFNPTGFGSCTWRNSNGEYRTVSAPGLHEDIRRRDRNAENGRGRDPFSLPSFADA